jgi:hypothetical protein
MTTLPDEAKKLLDRPEFATGRRRWNEARRGVRGQ